MPYFQFVTTDGDKISIWGDYVSYHDPSDTHRVIDDEGLVVFSVPDHRLNYWLREH